MNHKFDIVKLTRSYYSGIAVLGTIYFVLIFTYLFDWFYVSVGRTIVLVIIIILFVFQIILNFFSKRYLIIGELDFNATGYKVKYKDQELKHNFKDNTSITFFYNHYQGKYIPHRLLIVGNKICDGTNNFVIVHNGGDTVKFRVLIINKNHGEEFITYLKNLRSNFKIDVNIKRRGLW